MFALSCNKVAYIVLLCVLYFEYSIQDKKFMYLSSAKVEKLYATADVCAKEAGVSADIVRQIIDWPVSNDGPSKQFIRCVGLKSGYSDNDGHLVVEMFSDMKVGNGTIEDFVNNIKECNKITLDNNMDTLYAMGDCIHKTYDFIIS